MHTVKSFASSNTSVSERSSSSDLPLSTSVDHSSSRSRMEEERKARVRRIAVTAPTTSLEQCLLGDDARAVQRALRRHNYCQWFGQPMEPLERQRSDNSLSSYGSNSSSSSRPLDRSSNSRPEFQEIPLDDMAALTVEEQGLIVDAADDERRNYNNRMMNLSTNSFDLLEEFAPVSSKWSECVPASDANDDADALTRLRNHPHHIDLALLRKIVSTGCGMDDDDENDDNSFHDLATARVPTASQKGYRAMAWRVLLGYLPTDTSQWYMEKAGGTSVLQQQRELYIALASDLFTNVADLTVAPHELRGQAAGARRRRKRQGHTRITTEAGNASSSSTTTIPIAIQRYWEEKALDIDILHRSLLNSADEFNTLRIDEAQFLLVDDSHANGSSNPDADSEIMERNLANLAENVLLLDEIHKDVIRTHPDLAFFLDPYQNVGKRRYAALERILFVWSKYNKGVRYVQGMNEIVGILYYVVANDLNDEWAIWAEADTYWLLNSLLGDMRDVFISGFDEHDTGIQGRLMAMQALLHRHDPEVAEHLQDLGIEISFYAIRWWTTLLCREFLLPDTIRLWDSMFASTHKDNFLRYVCVIMVMSIRDRLLKGDFTTCLQLLHSFPPTSIECLLQASRALWIYESQISVACHRGGLTLHQALTTIESPKVLIMAFGFVNGTPPVSVISPKEVVGEIKGASVKIEATVRRSANELLGRAKGWYNRYNLNKDQAAKDSDAKAVSTLSEHDISGFRDEDDIYLQAISNT